MNTQRTTAHARHPRWHAARQTATCILLLGWSIPVMMAQEDLPFSSGSNGSDGALVVPRGLPARYFHAATYDAARGEVVVFGGYNGSYLGDTWVFDGENWTARLPANAPSPRREHSMAYDSDREKVVLFGGYDGSTRYNDTWEWDGVNWTKTPAGPAPTPRSGSAMAYDPVNEEVVLFGGYVSGAIGDTWVWNGTLWIKRSPSSPPAARYDHAMVWNGQNDRVLLFGGYNARNGTFEWDGSDWTEISTGTVPPGRHEHSMAYNPTTNTVLMVGGDSSALTDTWEYTAGSGWAEVFPIIQPTGAAIGNLFDAAMVYDANRDQILHITGYRRESSSQLSWTLAWDGTDWDLINSSSFYFDMSDRLDGIYHFTTIDVPAGVTVRFVRNAGNTPVVWLASGNVLIDGNLNLNGENGFFASLDNQVPQSGPGGYDGGRGGINRNNSGTYVGIQGQGPGGGDPGTNPYDNTDKHGDHGRYSNTYGNNFLVPLDGGSGGGGAASQEDVNGTHGGAGGGALLLASSRDLTLNGQITAKGGERAYTSAPQYAYSGHGSGGGVKLMADRLNGTGTIDVRGGGNSGGTQQGRIRLEGFERSLANNAHSNAPSASAPVTDNLASFLATQPALTITMVNGAAVTQPPSGDVGDPDVVFSSGGAVNVVVEGSSIPDGTQVSVEVVFETGTVTLGPDTMTEGTITLNGVIPPGVGVLTAFAEFTAF